VEVNVRDPQRGGALQAPQNLLYLGPPGPGVGSSIPQLILTPRSLERLPTNNLNILKYPAELYPHPPASINFTLAARSLRYRSNTTFLIS
jgi:hypothetical protein